MSERLSRGPLFVTRLDVAELNDVLRRIQDEIDGQKGLRGRVELFDRVSVSKPTAGSDATQLDLTVTTDTDQTITSQKTWKAAPIRVVDTEEYLIHAFGTKS